MKARQRMQMCEKENAIRLRNRGRIFASPTATNIAIASPSRLLHHPYLHDDDKCLRRCEEGCCGRCDGDEEEKELLYRYLEDQLLLVESMYECGDDDDKEGEEEFRIYIYIYIYIFNSD
ncbi:transmembrane protein [Senna tora]|uniref:Transmembrane protein n=1 Tax=Senna tora TaxID=362788 RepID=A0A834TA05_9FABA|nr:transmembrane protein [Senna tora]